MPDTGAKLIKFPAVPFQANVAEDPRVIVFPLATRILFAPAIVNVPLTVKLLFK